MVATHLPSVLLGAFYVEKVSHLDGDGSVVRRTEEVALGGVVDIAQSIVVTPFQQEMSQVRHRVFHAQSPSDAIIEFALHIHGILLVGLVRAVVEIGLSGVEISR